MKYDNNFLMKYIFLKIQFIIIIIICEIIKTFFHYLLYKTLKIKNAPLSCHVSPFFISLFMKVLLIWIGGPH